jgi:hypothetical protein
MKISIKAKSSVSLDAGLDACAERRRSALSSEIVSFCRSHPVGGVRGQLVHPLLVFVGRPLEQDVEVDDQRDQDDSGDDRERDDRQPRISEEVSVEHGDE